MAELVTPAYALAAGAASIDGDTIISAGQKIRIQNIYAPELAEPGGRAAQAKLNQLLASGQATIVPTGQDVYGRTLAFLYIDGAPVTQRNFGATTGRGSQRAAADAAAGIEQTPPPHTTASAGPIALPDWDSILKILPRPEVGRDDYIKARAVLKAAGAWDTDRARMNASLDEARRTGRIASADELARAQDVARRRAAALEMQRSEVPAWRQKIIRVLTAADNVEDVVSTLERISRPIQAAIPGGKVIGGALRAASRGLDKIQTVLRGPSIVGRRAKHMTAEQRAANARKRTAKSGKLAKAAAWLGKNYGALLEGGQAAETLLGYGIAIGPLFGALEETQDRAVMSAWHAGKWAAATALIGVPFLPEDTRDDLRRQANASIDEIRRVGKPLIDQIVAHAPTLITGANPVLMLAATLFPAVKQHTDRPAKLFAGWIRAAGGGAYIGQENPRYTRGEHALVMRETALMLPILAHALHTAAEYVELPPLDELPAARTQVLDPVTQLILAEVGAHFDPRGRALGEWAEPSISVATAIERAVNDGTRHRATWLPPAHEGEEAQLMHSLAEGALPSVAYLLTARVDGLHTQYDPETRVEMFLYHTGRYPPIGASAATVEQWWLAQLAACNADPEAYDERTWRRITARYW